MVSSAQNLLLSGGPWSPACDAYSAEIRKDLIDLVVPLSDAAEQKRLFPREALTRLAEKGHLHRRWQGSDVGDLGVAVSLYYETGRLLLSGIGGGIALHTESVGACLKRARPIIGGRDLYEDALSGHSIGCFAMTDPATGSDLTGIRLVAERSGPGYVLNGKKKYIGLSTTADFAVTLARTGPGDADLSIFAVPRGGDGYRVERPLTKMGTWSVETNVLSYDDVFVEKERLVGPEGHGLFLATQSLALERLAACALLLGGYQTCIELARAYARNRATRTGTIWDHQAVRHRFADLFADHQTMTQSLRYTAWVLQHATGKDRLAAALKLVVAPRVERGISEALQILGGAGYVDDWPLERALRDCRLARIAFGTDEIMREIVAVEPVSEDAYHAWLDRRQVG